MAAIQQKVIHRRAHQSVLHCLRHIGVLLQVKTRIKQCAGRTAFHGTKQLKVIPCSAEASCHGRGHIGVVSQVLLCVKNRRGGTALKTPMQQEMGMGGHISKFYSCSDIRVLPQIPGFIKQCRHRVFSYRRMDFKVGAVTALGDHNGIVAFAYEIYHCALT